MIKADEIRHLFSEPEADEQIGGLGICYRFYVQCLGDSAIDVLNRCKEVMQIILSQDDVTWPTPSSWHLLLPEWFVKQFSEDISQEDAEELLALPFNQRPSHPLWERWSLGWSLSGWIYYFQKEERYWYWWNASVMSEDKLLIEIEVEDDPFSWGHLEWLFIACGATTVVELLE